MHGRVPATEPGYDTTGNILLDRPFGAVVHGIPWGEDRNARLRAIEPELRSIGRRPYLVSYGASDAIGAMGYARMVIELLEQCSAISLAPTCLVHASGSGGTQAGILAMLTALRHPLRCIGIDVDAQPDRVAADVRRIGRAAADLLGVETRWTDEVVEVVTGYAGPSYGVPDAATLEAIGLAARLEALVLDPVYTGKGMAGLIGLVRGGRFSNANTVIWLHTGGAPGVFARPAAMTKAAEA
jgi:L-cysteate sulfo-lyase